VSWISQDSVLQCYSINKDFLFFFLSFEIEMHKLQHKLKNVGFFFFIFVVVVSKEGWVWL